ncbi:MAG TPA: hypothetical protein VFN11_07155 [Ktedonobacterales bacterium]|nr:hypothetical protein [Ktedonobacterales bacterium]
MREQSSVVNRYLAERARWQRLKRRAQRKGPSSGEDGGWKLAAASSAVRALAWVLGVDPEHDGIQGEQPKYRAAKMTSPDGTPPLTGARLTGAWRNVWSGGLGMRYWLLEVPAATATGDATSDAADTQYWAAFISERCVKELLVACATAVDESRASDWLRLIDRTRESDQPTVRALRELIADEGRWTDGSIDNSEGRAGGVA